MDLFEVATSAEAVNQRIGERANPRLAKVMASLTRHLHAFVKEVQLTPAEWEMAIKFLNKTGQISNDERQEFILLSDVLGVSMLVDAIDNPRPAGASESTVLGPFHVEGAPIRAHGESISLDGKGESCLFTGRVTDLDGAPIAGACVDVWADNADGFYDVQQPGIQPKWNNRGRFVTGDDGQYTFAGCKPVPYPIPDDGPVGKLLRSLGRHPYRPGHMHFIVTAPGFRKLVTHTFDGADKYIDSDCVFGVKASLIVDYERQPDPRADEGTAGADEGTAATAEPRTMWRSEYDFVLAP